VAGNVGTAVTSLAGEVDPDAVVVCEASSFQLEDTVAFVPEAAVLLNVAEDHLDRHGTLAAYTEAKLQAFVRQGPDDVAVVPEELPHVPGEARRLIVGEDVSLREETIFWHDEPLLPVAELALRGPHNVRNAMAAAAVALARGVDPVEGLRTFPGVAHRLEEIATRDGVLYVNDSKATNVASTLVALASFEPGTVHLILGGRGKGGGYETLRDAVAERVAAVYAIGEVAEEMAAALRGAGPAFTVAGDLEAAVSAARAAARPGQVVLLSPAATSWDQYPDFAARGEHFRALVAA
jgi:UDP-N-acetylmuramoylalanine--D-glutamate ligase